MKMKSIQLALIAALAGFGIAMKFSANTELATIVCVAAGSLMLTISFAIAYASKRPSLVYEDLIESSGGIDGNTVSVPTAADDEQCQHGMTKYQGAPSALQSKLANESQYGANSILAVLEKSACSDPVAAGHAAIVIVEQIRHAKTTAKALCNKADELLGQAELVYERGIEFPDKLNRAIELAIASREYALKTIELNDKIKSDNTISLLIAQRAKLDETISLLSMSRANLVPALSLWKCGMEECIQKARSSAQLAPARKQLNEFQETASEGFVGSIYSGMGLKSIPNHAYLAQS
jgi:hypothetical protein